MHGLHSSPTQPAPVLLRRGLPSPPSPALQRALSVMLFCYTPHPLLPQRLDAPEHSHCPMLHHPPQPQGARPLHCCPGFSPVFNMLIERGLSSSYKLKHTSSRLTCLSSACLNLREDVFISQHAYYWFGSLVVGSTPAKFGHSIRIHSGPSGGSFQHYTHLLLDFFFRHVN